MSGYQTARDFGKSHESAVLLDSRSIVEEELENPRHELEPAELHTIVANARQDISGMAILLSGISARQRQMQWLLVMVVVLLAVIAYRI